MPNRLIATSTRILTGACALVACPGTTPNPPLEIPAACVPDRSTISPSAVAIWDFIVAEQNSGTSPVPTGLLASSCNSLVEVLVDGPDIFQRFKTEISQAEHEVDIGMYAWDEDSDAARLIGEGLQIAASGRQGLARLVVRILITEGKTDRSVNRLYNSQKDWGLDADDVDLQLATFPSGGLGIGVFHDKVLVIDGVVLVTTGANPQTHHDDKPSRWHDSGYVLRGPVALAALASFDEAWDDDSDHWSCRERDFAFDCQGTTHAPPSRSWLQGTPWGTGSGFAIAAGRSARQSVNNETNNPQDLAWLAALAVARDYANVETPNINDDAFQDAVVDAAARGVRVNVITSNRFNEYVQNLPGQGGDNREIVGKLRQRMRRDHASMKRNLKLCWYSRDGLLPVVGKEDGPSHVKFLSLDRQIAVVGSGNMDTQSWNQSHEFNVVLDGAPAVPQMEATVFDPDWSRAICSLVELYEGNNATQDLVYSASAIADASYDFTELEHFINDEARSLVLYDVQPGRVVRVYDHPDGKREDDWLEIIVKRHIDERVMGTLQQDIDDQDLRATYHRNNGLDGKVSRLELASAGVGPVVDFYEGNAGAQNLVCSLNVVPDRSLRFPGHAECDNDEARSVVLYDVPAGRVIRLYDDPGGATQDDWTEVSVKRSLVRKTIDSFEASFEDADLKVLYHRNNGLDGKVSRVTFASSSVGARADLYEGNNGSQNLVCSLGVASDQALNFTSHPSCDNDEARSLVLYDVPAGRALALYDNPAGNREDDWVQIEALVPLTTETIGTFEHTYENGRVRVIYFRNNTLDGKVSRLEAKAAASITGVVSFYEGNNATQNKLCDRNIYTRTISFGGSCDNDEARSLVLTLVRSGTILRVYDAPSCGTGDDWTRIQVKQALSRYTVGTFESDVENAKVSIDYHHDNGLDGKVSCVKIVAP